MVARGTAEPGPSVLGDRAGSVRQAWRRTLGPALLYGLCFLALFHLAGFFDQTGKASLWFPAAGLRLAALLIFGWRFAGAVYVAELAAVSFYGFAVDPRFLPTDIQALFAALPSPVVYGLAAFVLSRWAALDLRLKRFRDVLSLSLSALFVPLLAAAASRLQQFLTGFLATEDFLPSLLDFWIGDTIGILMLTPLLLVAHQHRASATAADRAESPALLSPRLLADFVVVCGFLILISGLVEWLYRSAGYAHWYLAFLPLVWISLRHGLAGSIAGVLAVTVSAAWLSTLPVRSASFHELQLFVLFLAFTTLLMGSTVSTERQLKRRNRELDAARHELEAANAAQHDKQLELERFTYTVSHDLKSPLFTIRGFVGLLRKDLAAGDAQRATVDSERIEAAAEKMQQLLDDLLELSRVGRSGQPAGPVPLAEAAREAVELMAGKIGERRVGIEIADDLPVVVAARAEILGIFQNLIGNAVKYIGEQPAARIEIGAVRRQVDRREQTVIYVRDNGIGIDPEDHDKVFGLFDQLDPEAEGTGIGLAIVHRAVEIYGGRVWVESEGAGHGSTFCFTLPEAAGSGSVN